MTKQSLAGLHDELTAIATEKDFLKEREIACKCELQRRYGESALRSLAQLDKDHGTVSLPLQDGFTAKAEVKQEVKWDSAKLMEIARTLPFERVEAMFSIKFSMSETAYKGVAMLSPELRAKIDEARTTIIKPPAITLVKEG